MAVGFVLPAGCATSPKPARMPPAPLAMIDAIRVVDANVSQVRGTIRAGGTVDGYFTSKGRRRHYQLDGVLFFLAPDDVRFDLKKLGSRQFLFGSNDQRYWIYSKQDDRYRCGYQGEPEDPSAALPIRPDQIADALGLRLIGDLRGAERTDIVQQVVADAQQILILVRAENGYLVLEKEYWLDRFPPRLVRRVVFRDEEGVVVLSSRLTDYRRIEPEGPMLPYEMVAEWPGAGARMRFRVNQWRLVPQVGPKGPQFATPRECAP